MAFIKSALGFYVSGGGIINSGGGFIKPDGDFCAGPGEFFVHVRDFKKSAGGADIFPGGIIVGMGVARLFGQSARSW